MDWSKMKRVRNSIILISIVFSMLVGCSTATEESATDTTTAAEDTVAVLDEGAVDTPWGTFCATDDECEAPTDLCVMQPGAENGYCSIECPNAGADCTYTDWTCNVVGTCDAPLATWCGPPSEIDAGGGVLKACE
jgi:hypothetical protein